MHDIQRLSDVVGHRALAVIIDCGTPSVTSLALASILTNSDLPVVLVECQPSAESRAFFKAIHRRLGLDFYRLEWPLRRHGLALDRVFSDVSAERVLLADSDVELLSNTLVSDMERALDDDAVAYGSGFIHGPLWLGANHGLPERTGYYAARMWIPFTLLRTEPVRRAVISGASFAHMRTFTEFPRAPRLSRVLAYRFWLSRKQRRARQPSESVDRTLAPLVIEYDTGARIHAALLDRGHTFASLGESRKSDVRHLHGVSRARLKGRCRTWLEKSGVLGVGNAMPTHVAETEVANRLRTAYGIEIDDLGSVNAR